jgi:hypothetical protein
MTSDVEDQLREAIDRLAAEARVPAGLTRRARQRNRQRRMAIRAVAAAGTAVVAAVTVIIVTAAPQRNSNPLREQTVAYVTSRAQHALSAVAQEKAIEEVRATAHPGAFGFTVINMALSEQQSPADGSAVLPGVLGNVKAQRMTSWFYRGLLLQQGFSGTGKLVFSSSIGTVTSPAGKQALASYGAAYPARIRWRAPITGRSGTVPKPTCLNAFPVQATPNLRATISKALSCKLFALDGRQRVGGVNAIRLAMRPEPGTRLREMLWVDPSSYLPLRASVSFLAPHGQRSVLVQDYQWLPPTAANLAALHAAIGRATIPAAFRQLPSADLPLAGFDISRSSGGS